MGNNIRKQSTIATYTLRGRSFTVTLTEWTNSDGLSFDVREAETGFALHNESFDYAPTEEDVEGLIDALVDGLEEDPDFFDQVERSAFIDGLSDEDAPEGGLTSAEEMAFERQVLRDGR